MDSLKRDLEDPARPMKSSAFASEEPAPFTPVSLKGIFFISDEKFPRVVYLCLPATPCNDRSKHCANQKCIVKNAGKLSKARGKRKKNL